MSLDLNKAETPSASATAPAQAVASKATVIDTTVCPYCREIIKIGALKCKHCKEPLFPSPAVAANQMRPSQNPALSTFKPEGTLWLPVPSLIFGILSLLGVLDLSEWDEDMIFGLFIFVSASLLTGIVSLSTQQVGKGMAIAGIVMSALSTLGFLGSNI